MTTSLPKISFENGLNGSYASNVDRVSLFFLTCMGMHGNAWECMGIAR